MSLIQVTEELETDTAEYLMGDKGLVSPISMGHVEYRGRVRTDQGTRSRCKKQEDQ